MSRWDCLTHVAHPKHTTPKRMFFDLPAELRQLVYEAYCDLIRQELLISSDGPCNHQHACGLRSYADTLHIIEFKYHQSPYSLFASNKRIMSNPAYDLFVDMKLVSRQVREEFVPVWFQQWVFQLPRPADPLGEDFYPNQDDPENFRQMQEFLSRVGSLASKHVTRIRLTRRLRAQRAPEEAVKQETGRSLARMLGECDDTRTLVVHIHIRCGEICPSNRRASKDLVFKQRGCQWKCLCDGPTTVTFDRGWA